MTNVTTTAITSLKKMYEATRRCIRECEFAHRIEGTEGAKMMADDYRKDMEKTEGKILDIMLSTDACMTPKNWEEAREANYSLTCFDEELTQKWTAPLADIGSGVRQMGSVEVVVGGVTYTFSTVLMFDLGEDSAFYYHTIVRVNGEYADEIERQSSNYQEAANYGEILMEIVCEEDDDSDDPSQG